MENYIIDFHAHCFPDRIASRAIEKLTPGAPNPAQYDGTVNGLIEAMDKHGIAKSVVLNIATNTKQVTNVNNFAIEQNSNRRLYSFGSVHPDSVDFEEQIDRLIAAGIKGIKLHPFYQDFSIDESRMYPIYEYIESKKLILLLHMGYDTAYNDDGRASPQRLYAIHQDFPDITLVAAHMGGMHYGKETLKYLVGTDIYLETSYGFGYLEREFLTEILSRHDKARLLFGSDAPWDYLDQAISKAGELVKDKVALDMLLCKNAQRLLGEKG